MNANLVKLVAGGLAIAAVFFVAGNLTGGFGVWLATRAKPTTTVVQPVAVAPAAIPDPVAPQPQPVIVQRPKEEDQGGEIISLKEGWRRAQRAK